MFLKLKFAIHLHYRVKRLIKSNLGTFSTGIFDDTSLLPAINSPSATLYATALSKKQSKNIQ